MRSDNTGAAATAGAKGKTMKVRLVTRARLATSALGLVAIVAMPMLSSPLLAARAHRHPVSHAKLPQRHVGSGEPAGMRVMPGISAPARSLALGIGHGQLVTLPSAMSDVFVANDTIADVQVKTGNQLYVFGKAGGETTVYASNARGDVVWSANVRVGQNLDSIEQMLHMAMPDAHITTSTMNNTVLLTGTVAAPEDAAEAERLVKAFVAEKTNVISRLKMATPLQVNLSVKIAEVSRSLTRNISSNLSSINSSNGFQYGIGQGTTSTYYAPQQSMGVNTSSVVDTYVDPVTHQVIRTAQGTSVPAALLGTTLAANASLFGLNLLATLNAGEQIGLVNTLAEPNLTALSGETADFLAGGEYPIPVNTGLGATSIEFKKYGVSLSYTPTVLANGRISLRVRPEVSELTSEGSVTINGLAVPGLTVRRAETTVELGSGQSFMIAGLLKNNAQNTISKMPGAGDIPVLGSLFRSTAFKKGETELVIVITPYLVNPVDANQVHLPTDGFKAADALQQLLGHVDSDNVKGEKSPKPTEKPATQQSAMPAGQQGAQPAIGPVGDASGAAAPAAGTTADRPRKRTKQASADTQPGFSIQ